MSLRLWFRLSNSQDWSGAPRIEDTRLLLPPSVGQEQIRNSPLPERPPDGRCSPLEWPPYVKGVHSGSTFRWQRGTRVAEPAFSSESPPKPRQTIGRARSLA